MEGMRPWLRIECLPQRYPGGVFWMEERRTEEGYGAHAERVKDVDERSEASEYDFAAPRPTSFADLVPLSTFETSKR